MKRQTFLRYIKKQIKKTNNWATIIVPDDYMKMASKLLWQNKNYRLTLIWKSKTYEYYVSENISGFDEAWWND